MGDAAGVDDQKSRNEMLEKLLLKMCQLDSKINQQSSEMSKLSNEVKKLSFKQTDETSQICKEIAKINAIVMTLSDSQHLHSNELMTHE